MDTVSEAMIPIISSIAQNFRAELLMIQKGGDQKIALGAKPPGRNIDLDEPDGECRGKQGELFGRDILGALTRIVLGLSLSLGPSRRRRLVWRGWCH